jgi:two-component system sensor histidine kinase/response regulator
MIKILAIDDKSSNLFSIKAIIEEVFSDSMTFTALNGPKGIELAIVEDPDVILLDILMPGMDGFEVCRILKQDERTQDIPIIFLTAFKDDKESRIKALEAGAEAFLSKPIDIFELTTQIRVMVKIKLSSKQKQNEQERLAKQVAERTYNLEQSKIELARLLDEMKVMMADLTLAKERAERSDNLKTAFMQNISHEVRTPLNGIIGFGELLSSGDLSNQEREEYYGIVCDSSDRLMRTINDYMDISLIVSGNLEACKSSFAIVNLMDELLSIFQPKCSAKRLTLSLVCPTLKVSENIYTDYALLLKILDQLLDNAIKFTANGEVSFGWLKKGSNIEFFVKDTGIGIDEKIVDEIFNYFTQADVSNTRKYEGNGLGLAIAKGLSLLLGGKIRVDAVIGTGSTFYVTLPINEC